MKQNIQESALETGLSNHSKTKIKKSPAIVIALAFIVLVFDGYDLVVYGTIVKSILAYEAWGLTTAETGSINSLALVGMAIGSLTVGYLTDLIL